MSEFGLAMFDTPIGRCGLAWRPTGLIAVQLPETVEALGLERLRRRFPGLEPSAPPAWVAQAIAAIQAHLAGARVDLSDIPLDLSTVPAFEASVYREARRIPTGSTVSYGELAARVGNRGQARAVGQALGRNPWPIVIPCHRVTASDGRAGGFSAPGGAVTKLKLLELEGALAAETLPLFGGSRA